MERWYLRARPSSDAGDLRLSRRQGQIVVFTDDDVPHAVRAIDAGGLPSYGAIPAAGRFEFTPLRPGRRAASAHRRPGPPRTRTRQTRRGRRRTPRRLAGMR
jgi:hypothetical protein